MSLNITANSIINLYFNIFYVKIAKYLKIKFWKSEFDNGKEQTEVALFNKNSTNKLHKLVLKIYEVKKEI